MASNRIGAILALAFVLAPATASAQSALPEGPRRLSGSPLAGCDGAVAFDDGVPETGYGWVPSVHDGIYVQRFPPAVAKGGILTEVCVCWLRTRADSEIDFSVLVYEDIGGAPASHPEAVFPVTARDVPQGIVGRFYAVDVGRLEVPPGPFYVGVQWDASKDDYFFVCADTTPTSPRIPGFFRDERARGWASFLTTADPIFAGHRAMMVRTRSAAVTEVPALDWRGLAGLALALGVVGCWIAARARG